MKGRDKISMKQYDTYLFSKEEKRKYFLMGLLISSALAFLFYKSIWAVLLFSPFAFVFLQYQKRELVKKQKWEFNQQFRQGILCISSALNAGYSIENTFEEAIKDLRLMYPEEADIIQEFLWINQQLYLNETVENVLIDLARRTRIEDVENFAEIFQTAKRTGGDLMKIIQQTGKNIGERIEIQREMETLVAAKKMEANVMTVVPLGIILYMWITSPGFLDCLYHNLLGIVLMTAILLVYLVAYFITRKITDIQL